MKYLVVIQWKEGTPSVRLFEDEEFMQYGIDFEKGFSTGKTAKFHVYGIRGTDIVYIKTL